MSCNQAAATSKGAGLVGTYCERQELGPVGDGLTVAQPVRVGGQHVARQIRGLIDHLRQLQFWWDRWLPRIDRAPPRAPT
jgi:hypothetical protein